MLAGMASTIQKFTLEDQICFLFATWRTMTEGKNKTNKTVATPLFIKSFRMKQLKPTSKYANQAGKTGHNKKREIWSGCSFSNVMVASVQICLNSMDFDWMK